MAAFQITLGFILGGNSAGLLRAILIFLSAGWFWGITKKKVFEKINRFLDFRFLRDDLIHN